MPRRCMPWFNLGNSAVSVGLSRAAVDGAVAHQRGHVGTSGPVPIRPARDPRPAREDVDRLGHHTAYLDVAAERPIEPQEDTMLYVWV